MRLMNLSFFTLPIPQAIVLRKSQPRDNSCFVPLNPLSQSGFHLLIWLVVHFASHVSSFSPCRW
jgi:hypothetical protein